MTDRPAHTRKRSVSPKLITALVLGALALIFVLENTHKRTVHFLFWHLTMPTWIWAVMVFAAGVIIGSLFPWLRLRRNR
jgi:uncharacterized integral membrane protein